MKKDLLFTLCLLLLSCMVSCEKNQEQEEVCYDILPAFWMDGTHYLNRTRTIDEEGNILGDEWSIRAYPDTSGGDNGIALRREAWYDWQKNHKELRKKAERQCVTAAVYAEVNWIEITCNYSINGETPGEDISDYFFMPGYLTSDIEYAFNHERKGLNSMSPKAILAPLSFVSKFDYSSIPIEAEFDVKMSIKDLDTGEDRLFTMTNYFCSTVTRATRPETYW